MKIRAENIFKHVAQCLARSKQLMIATVVIIIILNGAHIRPFEASSHLGSPEDKAPWRGGGVRLAVAEGGGESHAGSSWGLWKSLTRLLSGAGVVEKGAGPRGVNSSQARAQRGCHAAATATATISAEEPGLLPDGQNSWLPGENSWPSPSFLRTEAEPQRRIAPHLGSWEMRGGHGREGEGGPLEWVWALGGTPGDEGVRADPWGRGPGMLGLSSMGEGSQPPLQGER